ncbi:KpsF/GutQ family sugar-phosphate isomerase [Leptospira wolffii]|uniref:KpsF/GutQ family sugar-phosphate isomerase n=1 Tax=Leptospira wolffii TaxID=409998 RepID=UPI0010825638|nr:KpsF/GutQ family sugar-phosphate isomerase [Leptospira wolffii]TGK61898.1 KpsF/GutQ family sugar-phosphate isomerase [Leptospira wolffii]TGK68499.1 KpsF/GutQ family sugar-phosphate isomerase [Leptospira wolffii]TGK74718.1 KpsF/GutQ family sugar-phosphate isomerase [Leptospira wolffii]TGL31706.1 KpsF/GutQ family sugar-phosphate isomerase [Leptospira wolffii]
MSDILEKVKKALDTEIEAIVYFRQNLDPNVEKAIQLIFSSPGKVIVTGVGKSGDVGKKIASTLSSTGTPAYFMHPSDAAHGDAGILAPSDVVIAIGKSGESEELLNLLPTIKSIGAKLVGLTANPQSRLALDCDIVVLTPVLKEACPLELAPTSSTTIALMLGDAIAMALMEMRNFQKEDFALYHPAGRLGKRLSLKVDDVMRKGDQLASIGPEASFDEVLSEITTKLVGATGVVDSEGTLKGFITDYDIRKLLKEGKFGKDSKAKDMMNIKPIVFESGIMAYDVLQAMERREKPISVAPIVSKQGKLLGIVSIHDLLQKGL